LFLIALVWRLHAAPCEAKHAIAPEQLVDKADLIVVATATGYYRPAAIPRAGRGGLETRANADADAEGTVSFTMNRVVKGQWSGASLFTLGGSLVDEAKEPAPDENVPRRKARGNACIATTYVVGGEYLFLFQKSEEGLTAEWAPLSPANERIRGEKDPWLEWVIGRVWSSRPVESH
jgi:hypothetical protein